MPFVTDSVLLKTMNSNHDQYYYIRPGQLLGQAKFPRLRHKYVYIKIKSIKKLLNLDLNMFMVKKLLWTPKMQFMCYNTVMEIEFVRKLLECPELKAKAAERIDFKEWEKRQDKYFLNCVIPLKQKQN